MPTLPAHESTPERARRSSSRSTELMTSLFDAGPEYRRMPVSPGVSPGCTKPVKSTLRHAYGQALETEFVGAFAEP